MAPRPPPAKGPTLPPPGVSAEDQREYDAFGPWVYRVRTPAQMPRRFREHYGELSQAQILLKVPRPIGRAEARPGMDLYQAVIAADDEGLTVVQLDDRGSNRRDLCWSAVVGLNCSEALLHAVWSALLVDGSRVEVQHSSVGTAALDRVSALARSGRPVTADPPHAGTAPQVSDFYFSGQLAALRRRDGDRVVPLHFEPKDRPCRDQRGGWRLATGVLFVDTPQALVVLSRGQPSRPFLIHRYATNQLELSYARLTGYAVTPPAGPRRFHRLFLHAGAQVVSQDCLDEPIEVTRRLSERGIPAADALGGAV